MLIRVSIGLASMLVMMGMSSVGMVVVGVVIIVGVLAIHDVGRYVVMHEARESLDANDTP